MVLTSYTRHSVPSATLVYPQNFPNGGSSPRACDFDDMVLRIVKWHPSVHGLTCTYSELVASRLGQLIDAPVVRGTVVHVDAALLPSELAGKGVQPYHVGFTYSAGQNFRDADYSTIKNGASLPAAAVQLAWLAIADQEGHNQYLYQLEQVLPDKTTRKMNHFIIIDQAMICGTNDWSKSRLNVYDAPYRLPAHLRSRVTLKSVEPVLDALNGYSVGELRECLISYPETWGITDIHVDKLCNYLDKRRDHLMDILMQSLR